MSLPSEPLRSVLAVAGIALVGIAARIIGLGLRRRSSGYRRVDADDPRAALLAPPAAYARLRRRSFAQELITARTGLFLVVVAVVVFLPFGYGATRLAGGSRTVVLVAGAVIAAFSGARVAVNDTVRRARRSARRRLGEAVHAVYAEDGAVLAGWGAAHGLAPGSERDPLGSFRIGARPFQSAATALVAGSVDGRELAVFHVVQRGPVSRSDGSTGNDAAPAFRWMTCARAGCAGSKATFSLAPRRPQHEPCPLNLALDLGAADWWRPPGGEQAAAVDDPTDRAGLIEGFGRLAALGLLPPEAQGMLERARRGDLSEAEARSLAEQATGMVADVARRMPRRELLQALGAGGWREVELESVELRHRYELDAASDDLTIRRVFEPTVIVGLLDLPDGRFAVDGEPGTLLVATPGHLLDHAALDQLLAVATTLAGRIDQAST